MNEIIKINNTYIESMLQEMCDSYVVSSILKPKYKEGSIPGVTESCGKTKDIEKCLANALFGLLMRGENSVCDMENSIKNIIDDALKQVSDYCNSPYAFKTSFSIYPHIKRKEI